MSMTEPDAGSNSVAMRTTARRDGDEYLLRRSKTFISNGDIADIIFVIAKTDPDAGRKGMSIFALDAPAPGLSRGRMPMLGIPLAGLGELAFDDVRVPGYRRIGPEGAAIGIMSQFMAVDRISTSARALAQAELAFEQTVAFAKQRVIRHAQTLFEQQNTQIQLAGAAVDLKVARTYVAESIGRLRSGTVTSRDTAACKIFLTEASARVIDTCVQLHGASGIALDTLVAKIYATNRQFRILAGTSELLKLKLARKLRYAALPPGVCRGRAAAAAPAPR